LRDAVSRTASVFGASIFVDRRVDPNERVTLNVAAASLDDVLQSIAALKMLGTSRLEQLRYLGPKPAAAQLRTVAAICGDEVAKLPATVRADLERKGRLAWARLTEPRALVTSLAAQRGWRIAGAERIPHDLWPAGALPELSASQQLTVLLIGFDLTVSVQASTRKLEIVPLKPTTMRRRYPLTGQLSDPTGLLNQELPDAVVRVDGRTVVVDALAEEHQRLSELLRGRAARRRPSQPQRETQQVYTLRVEEQPVGVVLRQLAERLNWTIDVDEASLRTAGRSLDVRVTFAVENSSQDELLEALLRPAGLDYRRDGERLRIVPRM
jgi:hypothetical protein